MSDRDQPSDTAAPEGARPPSASTDAMPIDPALRITRPAPARRGGSVALALLLALLAAGVAGYVGWRQWQQERGSAGDSRQLAGLQQRVGALESALAALDVQRGSLNQRLDDAAQVNRALREELLGQAERTRHLEDAVARLAEKSLSGRDGMLLDETESLLRMAGERYTLFRDAQGAAAAYALADQTLAAVGNSAFAGLRQSIGAEREALEKSQPAGQAGTLQQLETLRGELATLPLKPLDRPQASADGAWARIGRALAGVVSVQRDDGAPLAVADARFARELAALDLAQAQAALLAHDAKAYGAALQRVDVALDTQFDAAAPAVRQARAEVRQLAARLPLQPPVQLGAALAELRNLRAVHVLVPASAASSAPARGARP